MLNRFHSAVIDVFDFDAALVHYGALLGREPTWLGRNPKRGSRSAFFTLANMTLEIRDPGAPGGESIEEGLRLIRFESDESADLESWLDERGVSIRERTLEIEEAMDGVGRREWACLPIDAASSRGLEIELMSSSSVSLLREAPRKVGPKAAIRDLDHVVVSSADAEATRAFYKDGLELRLALDKTFDDRQLRLLFFRLGSVTVEIGSHSGSTPEPERSDRFGGLAWEVEDADVIRERLMGEEFDVSEVRKGHKPGTRVCTVRNPVHGVPTLLIEPVSR